MRATFIPTQNAAYPSKDRHYNIEVFSSAVPDREYEKIGIVEADAELLNTVLLVWVKDMLPKLMEEGCLAGGDALIIQSSDTFSDMTRSGRARFGSNASPPASFDGRLSGGISKKRF